PRDDDRNEKLLSLYMSAGMMPKYDAAPPPKAATPPTVPATQRVVPATVALTNPIAMAPQGPTSVANENSVDNIARVTEITRNIYRQANVKAVLFAAVNDVGRHWGASRCVA